MGNSGCAACLLAGLALWPLAAQALNAGEDRKTFAISRAATAPHIDGRLDDAAWLDAQAVQDFHQTAPQDGALPTENTIVRVTYDDDFLYISADMRDSEPGAIQALQLIQGKPFFSDDRFWVTLDSFNSKRNDYFFQVNANGVRREALRENNARFIEEWSAIWHAASEIGEQGWTTEIAIPFKSVSFNPDSDTWGINFGRGIVRKQEYALWSSHDRQDWPAYGGEVTGIESVEQGLGLDVVPSVNYRQQHDFVAGIDNNSVEPSLDIRYRITPSLSTSLTFNTDFSTTEIDDLQVALDRFSLFYPEKRDFFLQDAGIFEFGNIDTNGRPFFSRRIGLSADGEAIGIDAGVKLSGRAGAFNLGALVIRQDDFADLPARDLMVARGSMNVLEESSVGFIATHGNPTAEASNSVLGVDFLYRSNNGPFGEILTGNFWAQQSFSSDLDGDDGALGAYVEVPSDKLLAYLRVEQIDENFNPALGFVNRTGIRNFAAGFRYRTRPETGRWRAINHRIDFALVTNLDGDTLSRTTRLRPIALYSHNDDFLFLEWEHNYEVVEQDFRLLQRSDIPAGVYEFDRYRAEIATGVQRPLRLILSVQDGGYFGGTRLEKYAEIEWRHSAHFSLAASWEENDIRLPGGDFSVHLASLRSDIAFNSRWSWSNLVQYNNVGEYVGANSRLRYMPVAGREMLFVVNHGSTLDAGNHLSSHTNELNLKLSWTFRY